MLNTASAARDRTVAKHLTFLENLLGKYSLVDFAVRLWEGTVWNSSRMGRARCTLVLRHPGALKRAFRLKSPFPLGEAYLNGDIDIEGDMDGAIALADCLAGLDWTWGDRSRLRRLPASGDRPGSPEVSPVIGASRPPLEPPIAEKFFRVLRETGLSPDCACFQDAKDSLGAAQPRMYDLICGKLRLQEGIRLADLSCGMGNLAFHAARFFGTEVVGMGADPKALKWKENAIHRSGLTYRCELRSDPWDTLQGPETLDRLIYANLFDGMEESRFPDFFAHAWSLLRPGGLFLFQTTAPGIHGPFSEERNSHEPLFPTDSRQPSLADILRIAEWTGFELRGVENFREHGALTLRRLQECLEEGAARIRLMTSDTEYRNWRLFLATGGYGFRSGRLNLYQALLYKPDGGESGLPLPAPKAN